MTQTFVTGVGVVGAYCYLTKPSNKYKSTDQEYKATVILEQADGEKLMKAMQDAQAAFRKAHKAKTGKALPNGDLFKLKQLGDLDEESGDFVPDPSGKYELKLQKDIEKGKIKIVDCSVPPADVTTKAPSIAEGSTVRVMLVINAYNMGGKAAVSLTPVAVQLVELVEYGGVSMEEIAEGFGEFEGGYVADGSDEAGDNEAVDEAEETNDEEEDF